MTENIILSVDIINDDNKKQQALMLVTKTAKSSFEWTNAIFAVEHEKKREGLYVHARLLTNGDPEVYSELQTFIEAYAKSVGAVAGLLNYLTVTATNYSFPKDRVIVKQIMYGLYNSTYTKTAQLLDLDALDSANVKLSDYLTNTTTCDLSKIVVKETGTVSRKMAYRKRVIDWDKTWNSPYLTEEEKAYLRQNLDLDIWFSNNKRETYQIFSHMIETDYPNRKFDLIGLHGNFGSGKTEMVRCYAAEHNAPMMYINASSMLKIQGLLAKITPAKLTDDTAKAELTVQETIWLKCLKHDLYLIVNFDEFNLFEIRESNALAPIISEGKAFVDALATAFSNDHTILYVGCWNPDTANAKSLDGKMYDRCIFLNVEDIDEKVIDEFQTRKRTNAAYGTDIDELNNLITTAPAEVQPILKQAIAAEPNTSKDSMAAFIDYETAPKKASPVEGKLVLHHLNDVVLDSREAFEEASHRINAFINKVNQALYIETKGKDTKNPNYNFAFYVPKRAYDYAVDLIFQFSDVYKATYRLISDLIPGGGTVRIDAMADSGKKSHVDETPYHIAENICTGMSADIEALNRYLFDANGAIYGQQLDEISKNKFKITQAWLDHMVFGSNTVNQKDFDDFKAKLDKVIHKA